MPRRGRRRIVGKWEQIGRQLREDELKDLEAELHREWRAQEDQPNARKPRHKHKPTRTTHSEPVPNQGKRSDRPPDTAQ